MLKYLFLKIKILQNFNQQIFNQFICFSKFIYLSLFFFFNYNNLLEINLCILFHIKEIYFLCFNISSILIKSLNVYVCRLHFYTILFKNK